MFKLAGEKNEEGLIFKLGELEGIVVLLYNRTIDGQTTARHGLPRPRLVNPAMVAIRRQKIFFKNPQLP